MGNGAGVASSDLGSIADRIAAVPSAHAAIRPKCNLAMVFSLAD